jgi:diadenylate cyclase
LEKIFDNLLFLIVNLRFQDVIDLVLVWLVVYRILILIRRTGTVQMLSGLGILGIAYVASIWLELFTFNWLLEKFFDNLFVIMVILFQAEIRRALAQIGINPFFTSASPVQEMYVIEELSKGLMQMAQKGLGALVVIEREISVDYHIEEGCQC